MIGQEVDFCFSRSVSQDFDERFKQGQTTNSFCKTHVENKYQNPHGSTAINNEKQSRECKHQFAMNPAGMGS